MKIEQIANSNQMQPEQPVDTAVEISAGLVEELGVSNSSSLIESARFENTSVAEQPDMFQDTPVAADNALTMGFNTAELIEWADRIAADPREINAAPASLKQEAIFYEHIAMTTPEALLHLNGQMREWCGNNYAVMEKAIAEDPKLLQLAGKELQNDPRYKELVYSAVASDGAAYAMIQGDRFEYDEKLALLAVSRSTEAAGAISIHLLADRDFVAEMVGTNMNTFEVVKPRFKEFKMADSIKIGEETRYAVDSVLHDLNIIDTGAFSNHRELIRNRISIEDRKTQEETQFKLRLLRGYFDGTEHDNRPICVVCQDDMRQPGERNAPSANSSLEVQKLTDGYKVLFFETRNALQLGNALADTAEAGKADIVRIRTRGDQDGLDFSEAGAYSHLSIDDNSTLRFTAISSLVNDNCRVILDVPYAANTSDRQYGTANVADYFHRVWPQAEIIASSNASPLQVVLDDKTSGVTDVVSTTRTREIHYASEPTVEQQREALLRAHASGQDIRPLIDEAVLSSPDVMRTILKERPEVLVNFSESWKMDHAVTIASTLCSSSEALKYLPENLKSDKDFLLDVAEVSYSGKFLSGANESVFTDREFVFDLAEVNPNFLNDLPENSRSLYANDTALLRTVLPAAKSGGFLQNFEEGVRTDFQLMTEVLKAHPDAIAHIPLESFSLDKREELIDLVLKKDPAMAYSGLPADVRAREDVALQMIQSDPAYIHPLYIPDSLLKNQEFLRDAVTHNVLIAEALSNELTFRGFSEGQRSIAQARETMSQVFDVLDISNVRDIGDAAEIVRNRYAVAPQQEKETLTRLLGNEYFAGVEKDMRPIAVVCLATEDYNGAFKNELTLPTGAAGLMNAYRVVYYEMNNDMDWYEGFLESTVQSGNKAEMLLIGGHGQQTSVETGKRDSSQPGAAYIEVADFPRYDARKLQEGMSSDGNVILASCSTGWWTDRSEDLTGKPGVDNIAEMYNQLFNVDTWALTVPSNLKLELDDAGKFSTVKVNNDRGMKLTGSR